MSDNNENDLLEDEGAEKLSTENEKSHEDSSMKDFELDGNPSQVSSSAPVKIDEDQADLLSLRKSLKTKAKPESETDPEPSNEVTSVAAEKNEADPIFKKLAQPVLPAMPKENRARLQMQSPTRLYFYWSVKNNPFQTLNKVFRGRTGSYTLVAKLRNRTRNTEELFPVDAEGNWWFNVDSDSDYQAEIGFFAPNRPYIRVIFSNELHTPRRSPSKRTDYTPSFNINSYQFAEVLDVSGYRRDAFEVAVAGDDTLAVETATNAAYRKLVGKGTKDLGVNTSDEIRFVLLALASGYSLDDIRGEIDPSLYKALLNDIQNLTQDEVLQALEEHFDIFTDERSEEELEEIGSAVFGSSLVNFPKRIRKRNVPKTLVPKLPDLSKPDSISSFALK